MSQPSIKVLISLLAILFLSTNARADKSKPNIILYLADDLGYKDLAFMGHPYAKTPNLDKLASQGAVFMQHYVAGTTCAPSRAGLMTGVHSSRYPFYPGHYGTGDQPTITTILGENGYTTGHFGKWHMGPDDAVGVYGYDVVFTESNNKNNFNTPSRDEPLTDQAIKFIEQMAQEGKPFYANVWGHSTHYPIKTYPELKEEMGDFTFDRADFSEPIQERFDRSETWKPDLKDSMLQYMADVYGIDKNVGRIMETLERLGIADNTILVFSSDHGPQNESKQREWAEHMLGYAGHLRGYKGLQFEGGVRVPFIIRWPGKVEAGRIDKESVTSFIDWLPTLSSITEIDTIPEKLDGENISDIWFEGPRQRQTSLFWKSSDSRKGISMRTGKWKYHDTREGPLLFDLVADEAELINVASDNPEVLEQFVQRSKSIRASLPKEYQKDKRFSVRGDLSTVSLLPPQF